VAKVSSEIGEQESGAVMLQSCAVINESLKQSGYYLDTRITSRLRERLLGEGKSPRL
jgi:hypothetical protein